MLFIKKQTSTEGLVRGVTESLRKDKQKGKACYAMCDVNANNVLTVYKGGDVGVQVVRDGIVIWKTKEDKNYKNEVTRYLGDGIVPKPLGFQLRRGDRVIVASDFLSDNFEESEILVASARKTPENFIQTLHDLGLPTKDDNRGIVVFDVAGLLEEKTHEEDPDATEPGF